MSKIYFRFGAMHSSKSLQLLAVAHNYGTQGKDVICFKPALDDRSPYIETRAGFKREAIILDRDEVNIDKYITGHDYHAILIDEAQFLTKEQVEAFAVICDFYGIPVLAYGLKNDFMNNLFEGTMAFFAIADKIEEIKTVCTYCNTKASMNPRFLDGLPTFEGNQVEIGDTEESDRTYSYKPTCRKCYRRLKKQFEYIQKQG